MTRRTHRRLAWAALVALLLAMAVLSNVRAGMLGGVGQLMIPGQLQADPVLSHRIVTEAGLTITTETGDPLRTETDTP